MTKRSEIDKIVRDNHLEFIFDLHNRGVQLEDDKIKLLIENKYIDLPELKKESPKIKQDILDYDYTTKSKEERDIDAFIDVISGENKEPGVEVIILDSTSSEDLSEPKTKKLYQGGRIISKADWMPSSNIYHERDFVEWVDSINFKGFQNMVYYEKFNLYCQQADQWLSEQRDSSSLKSKEDILEYRREELRRCDENSVYFMNRYITLKEANMISGTMQYEAKAVHYVICFMFDSGYSMYIGKPRQIAATSTLGGLGLKKILLNKNMFLKMIAQDKEKVQEIFDDKIKYPFGELPFWFKPNVYNDRDNILTLKRKEKKGTKVGLNSKLQVVAPSVAAINGGSPNVVFVDEAGYISILGKMVKEGRPTMFMYDKNTNRLIMKRQVVVWGTGGEMDKGGKAFEEEYNDCMLNWKKRNFDSGIVPLFFDWTTRPGITKEFLEKEKEVYSTDGPDREYKMVQFRQAYPSIIEDMFLTSHKTLLSIDFINRNIERIHKLQHEMRPIHGYFEPIFDTSKPADENSEVPYKIIGAEFVPTSDFDERSSAIMFMQPKKNWINRYYAGVDPVASDNGYSKMSTSIWDNYYKTFSCIVNYRDSNHKYTFLQNMLACIYYDTSGSGKMIPTLGEANIGQSYFDYIDYKGQSNSMVLRTELPFILQGGQNGIGIDNRGNRNKVIINKMYELFSSFSENFYISEIFEQLRTFTCTITDSGNETWGTSDKKNYFDDILFSATFAYICSLCYDHIEPKEIKSEADKYQKKYLLVRDQNGRLTRRETKIKIH